MELTYREIYSYKDKDLEQVISIANEATIFKIETTYSGSAGSDKKVTFLDSYEAKAICKCLEAVKNEEKAS